MARHQTGHNSGVVHAGLYYAPGSLKAQLCTRGRLLLREFCADRDLAYEECGKVVVARDDSELPALRAIEARASANGVPDLRWLDAAAAEPRSSRTPPARPPCTRPTRPSSISPRWPGRWPPTSTSGWASRSPASSRPVPRWSSAARRVSWWPTGWWCAPDSRPTGWPAWPATRAGPAIVAFRGEYWRLIPERTYLVAGLLYPVPDPAYPFLGVHFTRRVGGAVDVGPNAVLALAREGYRRRDVRPADLADRAALARLSPHGPAALADGGARVAGDRCRRRPSSPRPAGWYRRSQVADVVRAPAGVRAQAVDADGSLVDDFRIGRAGGRGQVMTVRNAPSPGATSSLAIAEYIVDQC